MDDKKDDFTYTYCPPCQGEGKNNWTGFSPGEPCPDCGKPLIEFKEKIVEKKDLWPDDLWPEGQSEIKPPVTILREQASFLNNKKWGLRGEIDKLPSNDNSFHYVFFIEVPAIDNYRYMLFGIRHDINMYPLNFIIDSKEIAYGIFDGDMAADSEENFIEKLKNIFNSKEVIQILQHLATYALAEDKRKMDEHCRGQG